MVERNDEGQIATDTTLPDPKARIQAYLDVYNNMDASSERWFDLELMQNIRVISARTCDIEKEAMSAHCVFEVKVLPQFCNRMQNMHGGCVALLADMTTTMCTAPVSKEDFWRFGGVSRTLNVTYLQPVKLGLTLTIETMLRSIGKRLSSTQCLIKDKATGKLLAMGEHGKSALSDQQLYNTKDARL